MGCKFLKAFPILDTSLVFLMLIFIAVKSLMLKVLPTTAISAQNQLTFILCFLNEQYLNRKLLTLMMLIFYLIC